MSQNISGRPLPAYPRSRPRYAAKVKVMIFPRGLEEKEYHVENTANISLGGLFVCTSYKQEVSSLLHIRVILSDKDAYFDVKTRIIWVCDGSGEHPEGLGLCFVDLSKPQEEVIDRFLKDYVNVRI